MNGPERYKWVSRLCAAGAILGLVSVALPWWSLFLIVRGSFVASYNLFLLGNFHSGFLEAGHSLDGWLFIVLATVVVGSVLGFLIYFLIRNENRYWRGLLVVQALLMLGNCVVFVSGLLMAFKNYEQAGNQGWWRIAAADTSPSIIISRLDLFRMQFESYLQMSWLECLNAGFWLALVAAILVFFALYESIKIRSA